MCFKHYFSHAPAVKIEHIDKVIIELKRQALKNHKGKHSKLLNCILLNIHHSIFHCHDYLLHLTGIACYDLLYGHLPALGCPFECTKFSAQIVLY